MWSKLYEINYELWYIGPKMTITFSDDSRARFLLLEALSVPFLLSLLTGCDKPKSTNRNLKKFSIGLEICPSKTL